MIRYTPFGESASAHPVDDDEYCVLISRSLTRHPTFKGNAMRLSLWTYIATHGGCVTCSFSDLIELYSGNVKNPAPLIYFDLKELSLQGLLEIFGDDIARTIVVSEDYFGSPYEPFITQKAGYEIGRVGDWFGRRKQIPKSVRSEVFLRDGSRCRYCGDCEGPFSLDHIKPWSRGGSDEAKNLCVSCRSCNSKKSNKMLDDWVRA